MFYDILVIELDNIDLQKRNKKDKIIIAIVCLTSIIYLIAVIILAMNEALQDGLIVAGEIIRGKKLDYDYWHNFFGPNGRWLWFSVVAVLIINFFLFFDCIGSAFGKGFLSVGKCILKYRSFILYLLIFSLCYSQFIYLYIVADFLPGMSKGILKYSFYFPKLGENIVERFFSQLIISNIYAFFDILGIGFYTQKWFFQIMGIAIFAISASIIEQTINAYSDYSLNEWILRLCVMVIFVNPYLVGAFVYCAFGHAIGFVFATYAALMISKKKKIAGILLSFITTGCYETNIFISIILCALFVFTREYFRHQKKSATSFCSSVIEMIKSVLLVVSGGMLYLILYKIEILILGTLYEAKNPHFEISKGAFILRFFSVIWDVLTNSMGFMPYCAILLVLVFSIATAVHFLLKARQYAWTFAWILFSVGCTIIPFGYKFITDYATVARLLFSLFFAIGSIMIGAYVVVNGNAKHENLMKIIIGVFFLVTFFMTESFISDCYISQAITQKTVNMVNHEIDKYENETGIQIKEIVTKTDKHSEAYYKESLVSRGFSYTTPAIFVSWGQGQYVNYLGNRQLNCREMTDYEYNKYFGNKDYKELDLSEQLVFENDRVYWVIYIV